MKALIIVDIQNDFLPGGALAVAAGDEIIPIVNDLIPLFDLVVATQDWHPQDHMSFASNHGGYRVGDLIDLHGLPQVLWPDHCIQHTNGAEFARALDIQKVHKVFKKGIDREIDSYSGFFDNGKKRETGLGKFLETKGVTQAIITGLATDYCVKFTALDAIDLGFQTTVVLDAIKGVNLKPEDQDNALSTMSAVGVNFINSNDLKSTLT